MEAFNQRVSLKKEYEQMTGVRGVFVEKARSAAKVSIPTYYPDESVGRNASNTLQQPAQSFVAQGLQNLVSKSLSALLSLEEQTAFFKFEPDPKVLAEVIQETGYARSFIEIQLGNVERAMSRIMLTDKLGYWVSQALFHIFISGNYLLYVPEDPKLGIKGFGLDKFTIERDGEGNVIKILTKENINKHYVDDILGEDIKLKDDPKENVLITKCEMIGDLWEFSQEINEVELKEFSGQFKECPFIPLTFTRLNTNDYGTGLIEMYYGDIMALECLSKLIVEASIESAKIIYQVSRSAGITPRQWSKLRNGDMVVVNEIDRELKAVEVRKSADLAVAHQELSVLKQSLAKVFLQYEQRQADRVTAEEIKMTIQQLEQSLGSFYSTMSVELQLPIVKRFISRVKRSKFDEIGTLEKYGLTDNPVIVTGLRALGRVNELQKLSVFAQTLAQSFGPNALSMIKLSDFANRLASSLSISDYQNLVKSDEEMQAESQQAQQQAMQQEVAPNVVDGLSKVLTTQDKQQ